ncbi:topoisomerase DNA-binding C4 zinc finger domain-containing protein [Pseudomonas aeruginosa]|nr:topoisomerase DNA-binding C4 zinc finger domain-containing protein [Pseudomonas aeruginosa]MBX6175764.1 topoisomerase DNA-binding C4 zinc finger domain-containing protein [Pseudomonas aeruginosa]
MRVSGPRDARPQDGTHVSATATVAQITIIGQDGVTVSSEPCPACGSGFSKLRSGKYGEFFGCSNYPTCKWPQNIPASR